VVAVKDLSSYFYNEGKEYLVQCTIFPWRSGPVEDKICIHRRMPNRSVHTLAARWTFSFVPLHIFLAFYARITVELRTTKSVYVVTARKQRCSTRK